MQISLSGRNWLLDYHRSLSEAPLIQTFADLESALDTWKGRGVILAGYIAYEAAHQLEDLGPAPPSLLPTLCFGVFDRDESIAAPVSGVHRAGQIHTSTGFEDSVARIVERIYAGDLFQTNLCRYLEADFDGSQAWALYCRLPKAAHSAFLDLGDGRTILSMSPETFVRVDGNGVVESLPIKGTRRREPGAAEDLLASAKDRAELAMVVDVTRNDLSRVCIPGTVKVAEHAQLMTLPALYHTYSRVTGQLRNGQGPVDLIRAAFPPASITGAPKIEAMKAAFREEGRSRGPCMGAIGWIHPDDGSMELSVAIRTAYTANGRITYLAGCGITAGSIPAEELLESEAKAAAFRTAIQP